MCIRDRSNRMSQRYVLISRNISLKSTCTNTIVVYTKDCIGVLKSPLNQTCSLRMQIICSPSETRKTGDLFRRTTVCNGIASLSSSVAVFPIVSEDGLTFAPLRRTQWLYTICFTQ